MNNKSAEPAAQSRIERRKEKTKRRIITVAIDLIKQHGFAATTMEQIAEEVDIAKGTLYNYFPAKEVIINAYVQQTLAGDYEARIEALQQMPDTRARLVALLSDLMTRVQGQQDIFEIYLAHRVRQVVSLRPEPNTDIKSTIVALAVAVIKLGQQSGEIRTDLPFVMLVDLFDFVFVEVAKQFYLEPATCNIEAAIMQGVSLFMNGSAAHD